MAELDQPIVAEVSGDAIALGASIVFACDLIIAREDARIADNHLGMGEVNPYAVRFGVVPGDGGATLLPLFMSPVRAAHSRTSNVGFTDQRATQRNPG